MTDFPAFWAAYPSRHPHTNGRAEAEREWEKIMKRATEDQKARAVTGATGYATVMGELGIEPRHIMQGRRFLHGWHWEQYADIERAAAEERVMRAASRLPSTADCLKRGVAAYGGFGQVPLPGHMSEDDVRACLAAGLIDVQVAAAYGVTAELQEVV